eukprot:403377326
MSLGVSTLNGSPQKQLSNIKNLLIKKKNMTLPEAAENEEIIGQYNPFKKEFMRLLESEFTLSQNAHQLIELLVQMLFEIFDEDEDGCIKPKDILRMFIKTEKLQIYYNPSYDHLDTLNLPSTQRHQSYQMIDASGSHQKKTYKNRNKQNYIYNMIIAEKKAESNIKEKELILKKVETFELHNDQLITYREFMDAIKGLKDSLYKNIIPRILTFNNDAP